MLNVQHLTAWEEPRYPILRQCFDQQHICFESPSHQVDIISLIRQSGGLRSDDLKIGIDATRISVLKETERLFR